MTDIPKSVSSYMAEIGRKGGKRGKGVPKRRGPAAHYKRLSDLAAKARKKRAKSKQ